MRSLPVGILLLVAQFPLLAQTDTVKYFNEYWRETTKDSAVYYRLVEKKDNMYQVRDYYLSGKLQMEGNYSSLEPEIEEGYFIWYFENGQKFVEGNHIHGQREGIWTFWYPDGLKKHEIKFFQNKNGEYFFKWRSKREKASLGFIERAINKRKKGKIEDAEALLNMALANNPYSAEAYYERGLLRCSTGRKSEGCKDLKKAKLFGFYDANAINPEIEDCCKQ